jgi:hypothetical protein
MSDDSAQPTHPESNVGIQAGMLLMSFCRSASIPTGWTAEAYHLAHMPVMVLEVLVTAYCEGTSMSNVTAYCEGTSMSNVTAYCEGTSMSNVTTYCEGTSMSNVTAYCEGTSMSN